MISSSQAQAPNKRLRAIPHRLPVFAPLKIMANGSSRLNAALLSHTSVNPLPPNLLKYITRFCPKVSYAELWLYERHV